MTQRLGAVLRRVEATLEVPQPARSRILLELAADLEELYAAYRARGLSEEEAALRAEQLLGPSPEAVRDLIGLHEPLYRRLLGRYSRRVRHRWERALLTLLTLAVAGVAGAALVQAGFLSDPAPLLWPVLTCAGFALAIVLAGAFRLFIARDAPGRPEAVLIGLPALATGVLLLSLLGSTAEGYALARDVAAAGGWSIELFLPRVRRAAELLALGLTSVLLILLAWFHLRQRLLAVERAEAEVRRAAARAGTYLEGRLA